ncbi:MAG TPA: serine hydrolase domain-containing protein, partial [Pyrinomonadaceae bacterium]|nr:serine hydrolase domain-containing protein [Pyrinomonadaceae bacterium]
AFLRSRIEAGDFPSAVYLVAENGNAIFADALGDAVREPESHPATLQTIYDLASLTKPLITGLLCAQLIERSELALDNPIANYLPEFDRPGKQAITIRDLLTHTSGLPAWRPLYLLTNGAKEAVLSAIAAEPLQSQPGERVTYSDLGFITLGLLLQRLSGQTLDTLAQKQILEPLGLQHTFFNPAIAARTGVAACETGNAYERDMCERDFAGRSFADWRNETIWGEVHDGNAYFLGGVAGHAGLFSTVTETMRLANQFIGSQSQLLKTATCELFRQNMTEGLNEARSFAWQLASTRDSTAGPSLPPDAFGHTGFTGTSCWIDAGQERVFILLTNRTHNRALPFANINNARREFHQLAVDALTAR